MTVAEWLRRMSTVDSACHWNWITPPAATTRLDLWVNPPTSYVIQFINRYFVCVINKIEINVNYYWNCCFDEEKSELTFFQKKAKNRKQ